MIRAIVLGDSPCCGVPDRRGEVRVVEAGAVLRVGLDAVVAEPAEPEVVPASAARASPANDRQREEATAAVGTQRQAEKEELLRHHFEWRHPPFEGGWLQLQRGFSMGIAAVGHSLLEVSGRLVETVEVEDVLEGTQTVKSRGKAMKRQRLVKEKAGKGRVTRGRRCASRRGW